MTYSFVPFRKPATFVALVLGLVLTACGGGGDATAETDPQAQAAAEQVPSIESTDAGLPSDTDVNGATAATTA